MKKLSLAMIVKDEESTLGDCLKNAKEYADEIIIVDTGSQDNTKQVAEKFTKNIYDFVWQDDFSKARNFAFDKAKYQYIIWLDADDILTEESVNAIKKWKNDKEDVDVVMCPYVTSFDKDFKPKFEFYRERIVKNDKNLRWHDPVHEIIVPSGKVVHNKDIKIYHNKKKKVYTSRNLNIYLKMQENKVNFSPRQKFYFARELYYNNMIEQAINQFSQFLSEGKGWKENNIEACLNLARCYMAKKEKKNALTALFGSFVYGVPKGEILYEIGNQFFDDKDYLTAIYWYNLALSAKMDTTSGAFYDVNCYTLFPALQLCVCYYKIGDREKSYHYHLISKGFAPDDERVKFNEKFFEKCKDGSDA